jgi:hypothetical protein
MHTGRREARLEPLKIKPSSNGKADVSGAAR